MNITDSPAPNLGQQLDDISKDMDAAYKARNQHPFDSEGYHVADAAIEACYVRLRAWNAEAARRNGARLHPVGGAA